MSIISYKSPILDQIGLEQTRMLPFAVTDSLSTITTAGYLNNLIKTSQLVVNQGDFLFIAYNSGANQGIFQVSVSAGVYTLSAWVNPGNSSGSITVGHLPVYNSSNGQFADSGINSENVLISNLSPPDSPNVNMITFAATATFSQLASGGTVVLLPSSGGKQYKFVNLYISLSSTTSFGGGGDRNLSIGDGTTSYSVITAATLQSAIANSAWGSAALPFPAGGSNGVDKATAGGASVIMQYTSGTTDYTSGSIHLYGNAIRVT